MAGVAARPYTCEGCSRECMSGERGRLPTRCPDCRTGKPRQPAPAPASARQDPPAATRRVEQDGVVIRLPVPDQPVSSVFARRVEGHRERLRAAVRRVAHAKPPALAHALSDLRAVAEAWGDELVAEQLDQVEPPATAARWAP